MTLGLGEIESLRTDLSSWKIGPYHGALPSPLGLSLKIDGEMIVQAHVETGFMHRGLEKALELHPWRAAVAYADHLDVDNAAACELVFCLAVERISHLEVPARATSIRVMLAELNRISAHLLSIMRLTLAVGSETVFHYVARDRERVLDLFELLTGSRASFNFLRVGGVATDVTEGFVERVLELCDLLRLRMREYNDIFSYNEVLLRRTQGVGELELTLARQAGVTGPSLRASGVPYDVRKLHPYCGYENLDFEVPVGKSVEGKRGGDAHDRYLLRLREIVQSMEILRGVTESLPVGPFLSPQATAEPSVPTGEAYVRVESSRGLLGCHVVSDGGRKPSRVQFRTPSLFGAQALSRLLVGARVEDLPVILATLDLNLGEADR